MYKNMTPMAKAAFKAAMKYRYHRKHALQAMGILKGVEQQGPKLRQPDKSLCDAYAADVLGDKRFAPWLYVYTAISGAFKEGWIPDNYYGLVVVPELKGGYGHVSSLKPLNSVIFQSNSFPDLLSYANGVFFDADYRFVKVEDVEDILFREHERVVFKLDNSRQGKGVHVISRGGFSIETIKRLGGGLFQGFIEQHPLFNKFAQNSVATIRITTVYEGDGRVSVRCCYLRLGDENDTHVQSRSHIRVPIDLETGEFQKTGYTPGWRAIEAHPYSKVEFFSHVVPSFRNCLERVAQLHKKVPYARCIGWDVTVDREGEVKLMEWNAEHNDIKFSEATQGPCFSDLGWEKLSKEPVA